MTAGFGGVLRRLTFMLIKLKCCCGATFDVEGGTYINRGGKPDNQGRMFVVQVMADEWLDRHRNCQPPQIGGIHLPMTTPGPVTC